MAVYNDLTCAWCKKTLGIDHRGKGGQWLMVREAVWNGEHAYCPSCLDELQAFSKDVKGEPDGV